MKISVKQYAAGLLEALEGKKKDEVKDVLANFIKVLVAHKALSKADKIVAEFAKQMDKSQGLLSAEVTTAFELNKEGVKELEDYIKEFTKVEQVELAEVVDKGLLGGFVLKFEDQILDGSLKKQINDLKLKIKN